MFDGLVLKIGKIKRNGQPNDIIREVYVADRITRGYCKGLHLQRKKLEKTLSWSACADLTVHQVEMKVADYQIFGRFTPQIGGGVITWTLDE